VLCVLSGVCVSAMCVCIILVLCVCVSVVCDVCVWYLCVVYGVIIPD